MEANPANAPGSQARRRVQVVGFRLYLAPGNEWVRPTPRLLSALVVAVR
jgi:hypothetical protein